MARTKAQKAELRKLYVEKINASQAIYILEPTGLTANQAVGIKKKLYDLDSSYSVIKSSIFKIALEEAGKPVPSVLDSIGKSAVFVTGDKISEAAKVINEFASLKENKDVLDIKAGILYDGEISGSQVKALAELPSKEVLIAQVLSTMNAPVTGFVNVLAGTIRNFVNVVNAIKEAKENPNVG
jgi:large subunit ribosomal protein L10